MPETWDFLKGKLKNDFFFLPFPLKFLAYNELPNFENSSKIMYLVVESGFVVPIVDDFTADVVVVLVVVVGNITLVLIHLPCLYSIPSWPHITFRHFL